MKYDSVFIDADFCSTGLWHNGMCISPDEFNMSEQTLWLLEKWQEYYDRYFFSMPDEEIDFNWHWFELTSKVIAECIRKENPNVKVERATYAANI